MTVPVGSTWAQKTDEEYRNAILNSHGNLTIVAKRLGLARQTVQLKLKKNKELADLLASERDTLIDEVEEKLWENIQAGKESSQQFFLKTIGKARGWGESQEITINSTKEDEYDLSVLTPEERKTLDELTAKIYRPKNTEEESS